MVLPERLLTCAQTSDRKLYANLRRLDAGNSKITIKNRSNGSPTLERKPCGVIVIAPIVLSCRITRRPLSARRVCTSICCQWSKSSGSDIVEIAPSVVCQKWASPTALPSLNVLDSIVEMSDLLLQERNNRSFNIVDNFSIATCKPILRHRSSYWNHTEPTTFPD
jgi:hypothetical protein